MTMNWIKADWPAPDFIKAGTTLRQGGISEAPYDSFNLAMHVGDNAKSVMHNRASLAVPNPPQWLEQVHSSKTVLLPNDDIIPKADSAYTLATNTVCAVMTADCLPLLITNKEGTCVAAVHAGWRGLCDGIIENTINKLPTRAESLLVWLGPAIGAAVYEVGEDVYAAFTGHDEAAKLAFKATSDKHWLLDIYALAKQRLHKLGVKQIYGGERCSLSEEEAFFSYRRDGITGRMASMIWIEKQ